MACFFFGALFDSNDIYNKLKLFRNHGLVGRDTVKINGYNSRLDTFQAVVGNWLLPKAKNIAEKRIENANYFDKKFANIKQIRIPPRPQNYKIVYHLYIIFAEQRDELFDYCIRKGVEAKIHYPTPIYRQPALSYLNHKISDFPVADSHSLNSITFPCDQHLSKNELDYALEEMKDLLQRVEEKQYLEFNIGLILNVKKLYF